MRFLKIWKINKTKLGIVMIENGKPIFVLIFPVEEIDLMDDWLIETTHSEISIYPVPATG